MGGLGLLGPVVAACAVELAACPQEPEEGRGDLLVEEAEVRRGEEERAGRGKCWPFCSAASKANGPQVNALPGVLTERVRLRGLIRSPGGRQYQDPLPRTVISVGYSSHLPLLTS